MTVRYLIKIDPLMPYFFGGEVTLKNNSAEDKENTISASYFAQSETVPSQTTLFGTLRYVILEKAGLLTKSNSRQNDNDKEKTSRLIGEKSFEFTGKKQAFGKIQKISPLFLIKKNDGTETRYIKCPLNYVNSDGNGDYRFLFAKEYPKDISNGDGAKFYPVVKRDSGEYKPYSEKMSSFCGYMSIDKTADDELFINRGEIFTPETRTGVFARRNNSKATDKENFFKKQYIRLSKNFSFAFYADIDEDKDHLLPSKTTVFMGQDKSPFILRCCPCEKESENFFGTVHIDKKGDKETFYVAASDCFFSNVSQLKEQVGWQMINTASFHHLTTTEKTSNFHSDLKVSASYNLIKNGSVFYTKNKDTTLNFTGDDGLHIIGMNNIIKVVIGGNDK